jgi:hypothetical protein
MELHNYSDTGIDLDGWIIEDNTGSFIIEGGNHITSLGFVVFEEGVLTLTLNNSGETLTLYDPNGDIVDVFDYGATPKGISNIRNQEDNMQDEILQTQEPTPEGSNKYVDIYDVFYNQDILSINDAKVKDSGEEVCTQGSVTVDIGLLGKNITYIRDSGIC